MYQQLNITKVKGNIVTSIDRTWLTLWYGGQDLGNVSLFFPQDFTPEQIIEQVKLFRDSLTNQLDEFSKGGE